MGFLVGTNYSRILYSDVDKYYSIFLTRAWYINCMISYPILKTFSELILQSLQWNRLTYNALSSSNGHLICHWSFYLMFCLPSALIPSSDVSQSIYLHYPLAKVFQRMRKKGKFRQKLEFEASREIACIVPWQL